MIKIDFAQFWNFTGAVALIIGAIVFLWGIWKRAALEVLKTSVDSWKSLAETKGEEIKSLEKRISSMEGRIKDMERDAQTAKELQASTSSLNLQLQLDLSKLEQRADRLQHELDKHRLTCEPR